MNEKWQSFDTNTEITEMLEISDKRFIAVITKVFRWAFIKTYSTNENVETISKEAESFSKEIKRYKEKRNFRTEKYDSQNKKLNGQAQKQNRGNRGKSQWTRS